MDIRTFIVWMAAIVLIALNAAIFLSPNPAGVGSHPWTYAEFISVSLTAVTVVLAALALGVGILAIWGFKQIQNSAEQAAAKLAQEHLKAYLIGDEFQTQAIAALKKITAEAAKESLTGTESKGTAHAKPDDIIPSRSDRHTGAAGGPTGEQPRGD